jgi:hypothetical protein
MVVTLSPERYHALRDIALRKGVSCSAVIDGWIAARVELDERLKAREAAQPKDADRNGDGENSA